MTCKTEAVPELVSEKAAEISHVLIHVMSEFVLNLHIVFLVDCNEMYWVSWD